MMKRRLLRLFTWTLCAICPTLLGCSLKAGGWSVCFLDHANLELTVAHPHTDPNGPNNHP